MPGNDEQAKLIRAARLDERYRAVWIIFQYTAKDDASQRYLNEITNRILFTWPKSDEKENLEDTGDGER